MCIYIYIYLCVCVWCFKTKTRYWWYLVMYRGYNVGNPIIKLAFGDRDHTCLDGLGDGLFLGSPHCYAEQPGYIQSWWHMKVRFGLHHQYRNSPTAVKMILDKLWTASAVSKAISAVVAIIYKKNLQAADMLTWHSHYSLIHLYSNFIKYRQHQATCNPLNPRLK